MTRRHWYYLLAAAAVVVVVVLVLAWRRRSTPAAAAPTPQQVAGAAYIRDRFRESTAPTTLPPENLNKPWQLEPYSKAFGSLA